MKLNAKKNSTVLFVFLMLHILLLSSCKVTSKVASVTSSLGSEENNSTSLDPQTPDSVALPDNPSSTAPVVEKVEGFSEACYLERYPDVKQIWVEGDMKSAVSHYIQFGKNENRIIGCDPVPVSQFDERCYLEKNPDVAEIWVNQYQRIPVEHYILFGRSENRRATCL